MGSLRMRPLKCNISNSRQQVVKWKLPKSGWKLEEACTRFRQRARPSAGKRVRQSHYILIWCYLLLVERVVQETYYLWFCQERRYLIERLVLVLYMCCLCVQLSRSSNRNSWNNIFCLDQYNFTTTWYIDSRRQCTLKMIYVLSKVDLSIWNGRL